ncbi:relaxase domain-containing protein [Streptomyces lydicus]
MLSVAKAQPGNAWRYYLRGVAVGDGVRPARKPLTDAQAEARLPPGVWMGRGLPALGLTAGHTVTERQAELLFGMGRNRTPTASSASSWTTAPTRPRRGWPPSSGSRSRTSKTRCSPSTSCSGPRHP